MSDTSTLSRRKSGPKDRGLSALAHVSLTPELKAWLMDQPEDQSALIRALLEQEKARRDAKAARRLGL